MSGKPQEKIDWTYVKCTFPTSFVAAKETSWSLHWRTSEWQVAKHRMLKSPFSFRCLRGNYQKDGGREEKGNYWSRLAFCRNRISHCSKRVWKWDVSQKPHIENTEKQRCWILTEALIHYGFKTTIGGKYIPLCARQNLLWIKLNKRVWLIY